MRRLFWTRAGIIVGGLVYAGLVIGNGLDRLSYRYPRLARWVPAPFAADSLAVRTLDQLPRDPHAAARTAAKLVAAAPIEPESTALLGEARDAAGDTAGAERAYRVAGTLGWRVPQTQAYWLGRAIAAGDARVAAQRFDALLRLRPELLHNPDATAAFENGGAFQAAFVDEMTMRPPWLAAYAGYGDDVPPTTVSRRAAVLVDLGARGLALGCTTIAPLEGLLATQGQADLARQLHSEHCR